MKTDLSKPLRILMLSGQYPPMRGGVGDYTRCLSNALIDAGMDVSLVLPPDSYLDDTRATIASTIATWDWRALRIIRRLLDETKADWLHLQYQTSMYRRHPAVNVLPTFLRRTGWHGRTAVTFHDLHVPFLFRKAGALRKRFVRHLARTATVCIAADSGDVQTLNRMKARVEQIPIGSSIPAYDSLTDASPKDFRHRLLIADDALVIAHFATSFGLVALLPALAAIPEATFLLVGKRHPEGQHDVTSLTETVSHETFRQMQALGLLERTRWTGYLSLEDVALALAAADVVALPYPAGASLRHSGLMAALTQGAAIVTTTPRYPMFDLVDGTHFLAASDDPAAFAVAIRMIVADDGLRQRLSTNAKQVAERVFSWSAIARAHVEVYQHYSGADS